MKYFHKENDKQKNHFSDKAHTKLIKWNIKCVNFLLTIILKKFAISQMLNKLTANLNHA